MTDIRQILAGLTLEEKVRLVAGASAWRTHPIEEAGVPVLKVSDGPNGVRGDGGATAVSFPVGIALASTWNRDLVERVGKAVAQEAVSKDVQVVLGPTINLQRTPLGGRVFECYSEDPLLSGLLAAAFTLGVQGEGVGACVKHYVCNDAEFERMTLSVEVDERTLREIYLRPFELAIRLARPWTVMASYNRINGIWACSHDFLVNRVLKEEWGFEGAVISDWGAARETVPNALGGLDLEMPGPARAWGDSLLQAVKRGDVPQKVVDDKVLRLLRVLEWSGRFENPEERAEQSLDRPEHREIAYRAAAEGMVLLKNDGILPLAGSTLQRVALIGPNVREFRVMGGGSSRLTPHYVVSPAEALKEHLPHVEFEEVPGCLTHKYLPAPDRTTLSPGTNGGAEGLLCRFYARREDEKPALERVIARATVMLNGAGNGIWGRLEISGHYTAAVAGAHEFGILSTGRARLYIDDTLVIDNWNDTEPGEAFFLEATTERRATHRMAAGSRVALRMEFEPDPARNFPALRYGILPPQEGNGIADAVAAAARADAVVLIVGTNDDWETEGNDRASLDLPGAQDELIRRVVAANRNTVIVNNSGSPVAMPWFEDVPAVLQSWFPGQEFGNALADILLGRTNPSGKSPITFPHRMEDTPAFGSYAAEEGRVHYTEGVFVGHRWFDREQIEPLVPFGHGLSYTRFEYRSMAVLDTLVLEEAPTLGVLIRNAGERQGQEVVQLYVEPVESSLPRPVRELRGFHKIELAPSEEAEVLFDLDRDTFCYWDPERGDWHVAPGLYRLHVASSSRDIRLSADVELLR